MSCNLKVWSSKPALFIVYSTRKRENKTKKGETYSTVHVSEVALNRVSKFKLHSRSGLNVNPQECADRRDFGGFCLVCRCTLWDLSVSRLKKHRRKHIWTICVSVLLLLSKERNHLVVCLRVSGLTWSVAPLIPDKRLRTPGGISLSLPPSGPVSLLFVCVVVCSHGDGLHGNTEPLYLNNKVR